MDHFFEQFHIDTKLNYGKVNKFLNPLSRKEFGLVLLTNQIRYIHPDVFNYCRNYITFRATDSRDIATLKNQMDLQELHGTGYYSSKRKESYQIDFLMELGDDEVLVKRLDLNQPFPVKLTFEEVLKFKRLSYDEIKAHMMELGFDIEYMENLYVNLAAETIFEKDLGHLSIFTEEVIKFLTLLQKVDKIGNLYKSKLKEVLLEVIYPKASKRGNYDKRKIREIRDSLLDTLIETEYIIEAHPRRASGSQSIRTSYTVSFKFETALDDYLKANKKDLSEVTSEAIEVESGEEMGLEDFFDVELGKEKFNKIEVKKKIASVLAKNLIWNFVIIKEKLEEGKLDEVILNQRDIIRKFLICLYAQFQEDADTTDISNSAIEEAIDYLIDKSILPFEREEYDPLCNLCTKNNLENQDVKEVLLRNQEKILKFIHQIQNYLAGE
jgi:hypothetical protein